MSYTPTMSGAPIQGGGWGSTGVANYAPPPGMVNANGTPVGPTGQLPGVNYNAPPSSQQTAQQAAQLPTGVNGTTSYASPSSGNPLAWVSGSSVTQAQTPAAYQAAQAQQVAPYQVSQASNAPTPAAYAQALQTALAPEFQQNQANLNAQQAAMGTLTSGAGNYGDQLLTSQNNATYANALLPLIQQGYSQDATASLANAAANNSAQAQAQSLNAGIGTTNAGAINNALSQQYGTAANANLANATANNSSANAYANALNQYLAQLQSQGFQAGQNNQNASNEFALAQMGYGNQAYQQALAAELGLNATGLASQGNILSSGTNQLYNGYQSALQQGTQAGNSTGYGYSPYATGTGTGTPSYAGYNTGTTGDSGDPSQLQPYLDAETTYS